jgi:energy-coupling factor transporter ATP-binding protein EcfA2
MRILDRINRTGTTVVMATHDHAIVDAMQRRVIELDRGKVTRDQSRGIYEAATGPIADTAQTVVTGTSDGDQDVEVPESIQSETAAPVADTPEQIDADASDTAQEPDTGDPADASSVPSDGPDSDGSSDEEGTA